jgi:Xaa-Pro aminopeptidase
MNFFPYSLLDQHGATHLLLEDPIHIYYLSGIHFSTARLLISKKGATLFVDHRYVEKAKKYFPHEVVCDKNLDTSLLARLDGESRVAFLSDRVTVEKLKVWEASPAVFLPCPHLLDSLRAIKTPEELIHIEAACRLTYRGYEFLKGQLWEGITEIELAKELEIFFLEEGGESLAFPPIICFGENSAIPHHSPTKRALRAGDIVQFDIGCKMDAYCSDFSRVEFFGEPHPKLLEIASIVEEAKQAAEAIATDGTLIKDFDAAAREVIAKHGYADKFLHSLGHGLGLEIHEYPLIKQAKSDDMLKKGMVITIEPGIYLEGLGGVRLEDTYLITDHKPLRLTKE